MYQIIEKDNLKELVGSKTKAIVQYSAGWCGNCRIMKPKFKQLADEYPEMEFILVDAEKFPLFRQLANVNYLPTFAAFQEGELADQLQTNLTDRLKAFVDEIALN